jgi:hypothetical protein
VRANLAWGEAREAVDYALALAKMEPSEAHLQAKEAAQAEADRQLALFNAALQSTDFGPMPGDASNTI